jgi:hypothetical protein
MFLTAPYIPPIDPSVSVIDAETISVRSDTTVRAVNVVMHNSTVSHGVGHAETDHESREAEVYRRDDRSMQDTNRTPSLVSSRYLLERWLHDTASTSASMDEVDSVASPSQSRSSSVHPPSDLVDVFDGYSFKGRNSVLIDDEDVSEEEEEEEDQDVTGHSVSAELHVVVTTETVAPDHDEPTPEPKTPEARPAALPPVDTTNKPTSVADVTPRAREDIPATATAPALKPPTSPVKAVAKAAASSSTGPDIHHKESKKASVPKSHAQRSGRQRSRREKSGIPELDADLVETDDEPEDPRGAWNDVIEIVRVPYGLADESEKQHHKNDKKLKRGAEQMLSLFGSPR